MVSQAEIMEIVQRRIDTAKAERRRTLVLSGFELEELPEAVFELVWLQELDLSGNWLNQLPDSFGGLAALTTLRLKGNRLTALPESLLQLPRLSMLDLAGNQLTAIPSGLGRLEHLDLRGNHDLRFPPPDVVALGEERFLAYLRENEHGESETPPGPASLVVPAAGGGLGHEISGAPEENSAESAVQVVGFEPEPRLRPARSRRTVLACAVGVGSAVCAGSIYLVAGYGAGQDTAAESGVRTSATVAQGPSSSSSGFQIGTFATATAGAGKSATAASLTTEAASRSTASAAPDAADAPKDPADPTTSGSAVGGTTTTTTTPTSSPTQRIPTAPTGPITGFEGICLTTSSGAGDPLYVGTCDGGAAQQWTVETNGTVESGGMCLDVENAGLADGTPVDTFSCNGTGAQRWATTSGGGLVNTNSGLCLNDTEFTTDPGLQMEIWSCNGGSNEMWQLPS